ncbi:MAG: hypothetical protein WC314_20825 [Vulcanimicrobiota bacterium]
MEIRIIPIPAGNACEEVSKVLAQGHPEASQILSKIHESYCSCVGFVHWCSYASRSGLTGEALAAKFHELGSGADLIIYVLEQTAKRQGMDNALVQASMVLVSAEIRERVTW